MEAKQKAIELVNKYSEAPIDFPYIDTQDGRCIGSGYMTHKSAKDCAKICVNEIIKSNPIIPLQFMLESEALDAANEYWQEVLIEIDKL